MIDRRGVGMLVLAAGALLAPAAAQAQTQAQAQGAGAAPPAPAGAGDVIIVTGRDAPARPLDLAGSVRGVALGELDSRGFQDLSSLSYAAPNVSLDPIGTFRGVANFAIRGLGINSSIPSIDPAVALFVDGVYLGINAGTLLDALDVVQVDILRGPQGAAFGRNTTGGAVLVTTADPATEWQASARAGYESPVDGGRGTGMASVRASVSGPIAPGLSFRLSALHSDDGGYFRNLADDRAFAAAETTILRGALRAEPGGGAVITAKGEWSAADGDGAPGHNNGLFARDTFQLALNQRGFHDSEGGFAVLRAEVPAGPGRISSVSGWRRYRLFTRNDIDSTPQPLFQSDTATRQRQWSNETTYTIETGGARALGGVYLFGQEVAYEESRDLSGLGAAAQYGGGRQEHAVFGLFGQLDLELAETVSLKAGLRWSREEKSAAITYVRPRAACSVLAGTCPVAGQRVAGENNGFTDERAWEAFSPRLVLGWRPAEAAHLYASWSRGQRSGGYNLRITQPAAFEQVAATLGSPAFDEERADSFELGAKWEAPEGRLFVAGALFWNEVDNLQREVNVPSLASGLAQSVYNTADARLRGGEIEAWWRPAGGWSLSANVGHVDADYRAVRFDLTGDGAIGAADLALELPRAPRWTFGGSAAYAVAVGASKTLEASIFYQHRSRFAYTDNNWGFNDASSRLDAALALSCEECGLTLRLFGRNLLDEVQFGGDTQLAFAAGPLSDGNNRPFDPRPGAGTFSPLLKGRSIGVEIAASF